MEISDLLSLVKAGFTKNEIISLTSASTEQLQAELSPSEPVETATSSKQSQEELSDTSPADTASPKEEVLQYKDAFSDVLKELASLKSMVQKTNINTLSMEKQKSDEVSADDITKLILGVSPRKDDINA